MNERSRRLEIAFENIARTRMVGLPFLNPQLRVEAVGFREWEGQWIGVLVTPWSMNIVLMPGEGAWPQMASGAERFVELPAGRFRFIAANDPALGDYHACSLFSPALEFASHEAAHATAAAALAALFDPAAECAPAAPLSRREFLRGRRDEARDADRR